MGYQGPEREAAMTILELLGVDPEAGLLSTGTLVHIAMLGYVAGFILKNQIGLRSLVLFATCFYIAYYYYHPETPLWGAIFASLMILLANLIGLSRILYGRMKLAMPADQVAIYDAMAGLQPGEFRKLMSLGEVRTTERETRLTTEGETPDHLYFIAEGAPVAEKGGRRFDVPPRHFIGEISFVLGTAATATVRLPAGGRYVMWDKDKLRRAFARSPELERGFEALLSRDMASKVSTSVQIERLHPEWRGRGLGPEPALAPVVATA